MVNEKPCDSKLYGSASTTDLLISKGVDPGGTPPGPLPCLCP